MHQSALNDIASNQKERGFVAGLPSSPQDFRGCRRVCRQPCTDIRLSALHHRVSAVSLRMCVCGTQRNASLIVALLVIKCIQWPQGRVLKVPLQSCRIPSNFCTFQMPFFVPALGSLSSQPLEKMILDGCNGSILMTIFKHETISEWRKMRVLCCQCPDGLCGERGATRAHRRRP